MWIKIEGGRMINLDQVVEITLDDMHQSATLRAQGLQITSAIAYQQIKDGVLDGEPTA